MTGKEKNQPKAKRPTELNLSQTIEERRQLRKLRAVDYRERGESEFEESLSFMQDSFNNISISENRLDTEKFDQPFKKRDKLVRTPEKNSPGEVQKSFEQSKLNEDLSEIGACSLEILKQTIEIGQIPNTSVQKQLDFSLLSTSHTEAESKKVNTEFSLKGSETPVSVQITEEQRKLKSKQTQSLETVFYQKPENLSKVQNSFTQQIINQIPNSENNRETRTNNNESEEMALSIQQVIDLVPEFNGEQNQLDQFLTTVQALNDNIDAANRALFIVIVKSKLKGKAFEIINAGNFNTLEEIKNALTRGIKPKIDMQTATQNLFRIKQNSGESTKDYSERIKKALAQLDDVTMREVPEALRNEMNTHNQKLAKQTFEANLYNFSLKTIVISAEKVTLSDSIDFALTQEQKFFSQKTQNTNSNRNLSNNNNNNNNKRSENFPGTSSGYSSRPIARPQFCYKC